MSKFKYKIDYSFSQFGIFGISEYSKRRYEISSWLTTQFGEAGINWFIQGIFQTSGYRIDLVQYMFKNEEDAVAFKLRWL